MVATKNLELFVMSKLDQEEQEILEAFDSGQLKKRKMLKRFENIIRITPKQ